MRKILAAVAALFALHAPAEAANYVTTGYSCSGSVCYNLGARLQPFDASLGDLTNIVLKLDVVSQSALIAQFTKDTYPNPQTGSAHISFDGPFSVSLNGTTYTLNISGDQDFSYTGLYVPIFEGPTFTAFGSKSFEIDKSLYSSFVGGVAGCGPLGSNGLCGSTLTQPPYAGGDLVFTDVNNLRFSNYDTYAEVRWSLTYVFRPVPEPSTWAMMLIGFTGIGLTVRRQKKAAAVTLPPT